MPISFIKDKREVMLDLKFLKLAYCSFMLSMLSDINYSIYKTI